MNNVNKTLYIPLYGKAYVSKRNIILRDDKALEIWEKEGFKLKGKAKSKWLAFFMAMRAAIYDEWVKGKIEDNKKAIVLHIGCGLDSRVLRVGATNAKWYDIDFSEVNEERKKYYVETDDYHMLSADMRKSDWQEEIEAKQDAIVIMEGVSMYFAPDELTKLLFDLCQHFNSVALLMDCYSKKAAKASKFKNPINEVGVRSVYGYDNPQEVADKTGLCFVKEHEMTPAKYINELKGMERVIFQKLYAGSIAKSLYKMYEFKKS